MSLRSSLLASLTTRGAAASAAAVLMVGGGVAVAQSGAPQDAEIEVLDDEDAPLPAPETDDVGDEDGDCPEADRDGLDTENPADAEQDECPPDHAGTSDEEATDDDLPIEEITEDDIDAADEEELPGPDARDADAQGDAQAFSLWVESLPDDLGCLKGQLVRHVARQGPTNPETDLPAGIQGVEDALAALDELTGGEVDLPGRCAEQLVDGGQVEGSSSESSRPDHAGREGRPDHAGTPGPPDHANAPADAGPPDHANAPADAGPPDHAGPKGTSGDPGNSGSAPGRSGNNGNGGN